MRDYHTIIQNHSSLLTGERERERERLHRASRLFRESRVIHIQFPSIGYCASEALIVKHSPLAIGGHDEDGDDNFGAEWLVR